MSMHNLDACHGDEHLGPDLSALEIRAIAQDFWDGALFDTNTRDTLPELLAGDEACKTMLLRLFTLDLRRFPQQILLINTIKELRKQTEELVKDQILQGNIRANTLEE